MSFRPDGAVSSSTPVTTQSAMGDPFRLLFLNQVESIVGREPNRESLLALLQLSNPSLTGLGSDNDARTRLSQLQAQIHPTQHPQDSARAARLHSAVQTFYAQAISSQPRKKSRNSYSPDENLPHEFDALGKFTHMRFDDPDVRQNTREMVWTGYNATYRMTRSTNKARVVAYQCMNARGAIAHGKTIEQKFEVTASEAEQTVEQVFRANGGAKTLGGIDEVKLELMTKRPVVSTSFNPSQAFLKTNSLGMTVNSKNDDLLVLISGWKQLTSGEVWIVHYLSPIGSYEARSPSQTSNIAIGQFGIDDVCIAPTSKFDNVSWQKGPYFDARITVDTGDWWKLPNTKPNMIIDVDSMSELDQFFRESGKTTFNGNHNHSSFTYGSQNSSIAVTIRDKYKNAHSKRATMQSVEWDPAKGKFAVEFVFTEGQDKHNRSYF